MSWRGFRRALMCWDFVEVVGTWRIPGSGAGVETGDFGRFGV